MPKISELPSAGSVNTTDILPLVQSGVTYKAPFSLLPISIAVQAALDTKVNTSAVGTMAAQNANNVAITGGSMSGVTVTGGSVSGLSTDLAVADGGTGASTAAAARTNLGAAASGANADITSMSALVGPGLLPVGTVIHVCMNAAPTGFLKADGTAVSRTTYAALFTAIGTTFGTGDGSTTFNLPDLRGEFIRSWSDGKAGVDVGRVLGSNQAEQVGTHNHPIRASNSGFTGGNPAVQYAAGDNNGNSLVAGGGATFGVQNNSGTENRPRNVALLACIKF